MSDINLLTANGIAAQQSVIGSMLIDERCIGVVLAGLRPEDFTDGTCRNVFSAIRRLTLAGRPADLVTVLDELSGGESLRRWMAEVMEVTPTAANVEAYMEITRQSAAVYGIRALADKLLSSWEPEEVRELVRKMSALLSATSRMPRMTGAELARDFMDRMSSEKKPEYLPWGIPTADRTVYTELGDMVLLGGYPSSGKTLLSILMALAQAKRYRVGYYTLETQPEKMADRIFAHLSGVPLGRLKTRDFGEQDWTRLAQAASDYASVCPFDIIKAAGSSVEDIAADAVGHGYQIVYVDYLQLIEAPGIRAENTYAAVSAVSRGLKLFAQRTGTAVVALAQFSRPPKGEGGKGGKLLPPSMNSFRDSGQIEQDADAAFLLWPSDPNDNESDRVFKLGKNKEGRKFKIHLAFNGATQTMVELEEQPDNSVAAEMSARGRAVKRINRASDSGQVRFQELPGGDADNPFV